MYPPAAMQREQAGAPGARGREVAGVVFDLDGTLYDKRTLERFMIRRLPWGLYRLYRYTKVRSSLAGEDHGSFAEIQRETLLRLSRSARGQARWQRWIDEVYDPLVLEGMRTATRPYRGVAELLAELRAGGLRLGLVSDYRGVDERLAALEIDAAAFDFVLVTEGMGAMKPAPRVVEATLQGMGCAGASLVMVGDRAFADQRFAEAAGMEFVGVLAAARGASGDPRWREWDGVRGYLQGLVR